MESLRISIKPLSAFGSPLLGDTLFGQVCWSIVQNEGEQRLNALLEGYTSGQPFLVLSDAFVRGHIPRPSMPLHYFQALAGEDRKAVKKKRWMPVERLQQPLSDWLRYCVSDDTLGDAARVEQHLHPHNQINRLTGTTGKGFAPYSQNRLWHGQGALLDLYASVDAERFSADELGHYLDAIGSMGYGRDASIGLGKFQIDSLEPWNAPHHSDANACLTLAACAPQGQGFVQASSYYELFTRFGRHGGAAVFTGKPFKNPVLLAKAGALLTPRQMPSAPIIGQGLSGVSKAMPNTVQQGYANYIGIHLPQEVTTP
jgi:CRISPR-associated protein Csm4